MALGAIVSVLTLVRIVLLMAGKTIGRYAPVDAVDMAIRAGHPHVFPCQFVRRNIVIECRRWPVLRRMAGGAIPSQQT